MIGPNIPASTILYPDLHVLEAIEQTNQLRSFSPSEELKGGQLFNFG
jgi:hypothetical protein